MRPPPKWKQDFSEYITSVPPYYCEVRHHLPHKHTCSCSSHVSTCKHPILCLQASKKGPSTNGGSPCHHPGHDGRTDELFGGHVSEEAQQAGTVQQQWWSTFTVKGLVLYCKGHEVISIASIGVWHARSC